MTLGSHQATIGASQDCFTPRWITDPLGPFATDVCAGTVRPWDIGTARNITKADNSLAMDWRPFGRQYCNPPFDRREVGAFVGKMCTEGTGILLLHVRTETEWFRPIWHHAHGLLFLGQRVIFCDETGAPITIRNPAAKHFGKTANSGTPVVLCGFGAEEAERLEAFDLRDAAEIAAFDGRGRGVNRLAGHFVPLRIPVSVLVQPIASGDGCGDTWPQLVRRWLAQQTGPVRVSDLYRLATGHPKAAGSLYWREQIRKVLQLGAGARVGPDQWVAAS